MDKTNKGICKYCGNQVCWDQKYVRIPHILEEEQEDYEEYVHLDCYLKEYTNFMNLLSQEP